MPSTIDDAALPSTIDDAASNDMLSDEEEAFDAVFNAPLDGGDAGGVAEEDATDSGAVKSSKCDQLDSDEEEASDEASAEKKSDDWTSEVEDAEMGGGDDAAAESVALKSSGNDGGAEDNPDCAGDEKTDGGFSDEAFLPNAPPPPPPPARPAPFRNQKQDDFVKKGARARTLVTTALRAMAEFASSTALADAACSGNTDGDKDAAATKDADGSSKKTWNARADFAHIQELAQERAEECLALKGKLQEAQSEIDVLQSERAASEASNAQLQAKIDRTLEALQIAGANAANARAEADASNTRAESLSGQLNDLQSVIEETKRGMEVVRREHDEVSRAARSVESRLIAVEGELTRAARAKKDAVEERDFLKSRADEAEKLARDLQDRADDYHDEVRMLKKDLLEMEEFERARTDRTHRLETEFQEARAGLLEATSAAAEAESTVTSLRSVVEELRKENETLHERMEESRSSASKELAKQNEALTVAEREAQSFKLKVEESDDIVRRLQTEKASAEKQVENLRSRVATMERRLNDSSKSFSSRDTEKATEASSTITPKSSDLGFLTALDAPLVSDESKKRKFVDELPQREAPKDSSSRQLTYSFQKENKATANQQKEWSRSADSVGPKRSKAVRTTRRECCLCGKEGGMVLSCQCEAYCGKRAHALCIGKFRSGKEDSSKPTILCGEATA